jgi:hypothetical protein
MPFRVNFLDQIDLPQPRAGCVRIELGIPLYSSAPLRHGSSGLKQFASPEDDEAEEVRGRSQTLIVGKNIFRVVILGRSRSEANCLRPEDPCRDITAVHPTVEAPDQAEKDAAHYILSAKRIPS